MSDFPKTLVSPRGVTVQVSTPREANDLRNQGYQEQKRTPRAAAKPEPEKADSKTDSK